MKYCRFPPSSQVRTGRVVQQHSQNDCQLKDRGRRFVCGWQQRNCGGPFLPGISWSAEKPDRR